MCVCVSYEGHLALCGGGQLEDLSIGTVHPAVASKARGHFNHVTVISQSDQAHYSSNLSDQTI